MILVWFQSGFTIYRSSPQYDFGLKLNSHCTGNLGKMWKKEVVRESRKVRKRFVSPRNLGKLQNLFKTDYHQIKSCNFHLKNVMTMISCSRSNFSQNAKNSQENLCPGQGKSQGKSRIIFQIFVWSPVMRDYGSRRPLLRQPLAADMRATLGGKCLKFKALWYSFTLAPY